MEIEIRNFGPINQIKFDLKKDLHLIYGKNGIGKSYATYCIYCLLKNINNKRIVRKYRRHYSENSFEKVIKSKLKFKSNKRVDITSDFERKIEIELKDVLLDGLKNSFKNTFYSLIDLKNKYNNENYEIIVHITEEEKIIFLSNDQGDLDLKVSLGNNKIYLVEKNTKTTKYSLYINGKMIYGKPNEDEFLNEFHYWFLEFVNEKLRDLDSDIRDIYYLPASRSGLYQALSAFTPILAELTQNRFFIKNKSIELPSLTEPLSDYFIDLSTLDKKKVNEEYIEIIKMLEDDILKGNVDYDEDTKKIMYKPKGLDLVLNLSQVSSMVAELSPLVLYFKHILNNKFFSSKDPYYFDPFYERRRRIDKGYDIIFIEEPEAHLHPEVQVKLIELFSRLSSLKLKIFITSHSNYMFNKINNILLKKDIVADKVIVYHLINGENGSVSNDDMKVSQEGINDENFQDITEQLYYERLKSLEENDR
ncbi:AAA family ATPase [Flavobacterium rakeshii]|uniref:AAA family ATPase n=1 Tax=Flavobacterium rakeshii TaxID=1038845 RepID=UPI002E7ABC87|nr:AAA family ATPase [Flavobacterium rakeshii]MEE1898953.1 AAA family ATPase [Flavobacterium rakeshii]